MRQRLDEAVDDAVVYALRVTCNGTRIPVDTSTVMSAAIWVTLSTDVVQSSHAPSQVAAEFVAFGRHIDANAVFRHYPVLTVSEHCHGCE